VFMSNLKLLFIETGYMYQVIPMETICIYDVLLVTLFISKPDIANVRNCKFYLLDYIAFLSSSLILGT
jgi:hypothetical protein